MKNNYRVEISNWDEVKNQFGLEIAKLISKNLKKEFDKSEHYFPDHLEPMYDSEGYALMELLGKTATDTVYYLYTGSAK